jgi:hypothetical protein
MTRTCPQCSLTLLGHQEHADWDDCGPALRGHYQALLRRHRLAVRRGDTKAQGFERWRTRAQIAEAQIREMERGDAALARVLRLEKRIAVMERRAA